MRARSSVIINQNSSACFPILRRIAAFIATKGFGSHFNNLIDKSFPSVCMCSSCSRAMFHHSYKMDESCKCCISGHFRQKCRRPLCHSFPLTLFPCSSVCPSHWLESFTERSCMGPSPRATAPARNLLQHGPASSRPWPLHRLQLPSGHGYPEQNAKCGSRVVPAPAQSSPWLQ